MLARHSLPLTFLITGFGWLFLSSVLGLASLIGVVLGTPLPPWVRLVHVHAALIGGVVQLIIGGFLVMLPPPPPTGPARHQAHPLALLVFNAGTIGILAGFWTHQTEVVNAAGLLIAGTCAWIARLAWIRSTQSLPSTPNRWYYTVAFLALFAGITCGGALAFPFAYESYGYVRLAHIHLGLLGFIILVIVGAMHVLAPTVLAAPLSDTRLGKVVSIMMPLGTAGLIGGFLNSSVPIEIGAGAILFVAGTIYAINLVRTWMSSPHSGNAASDHLLLSTFFLLLTIVLGILVGANSLSTPPMMPYGTLHMMAYAHMAFLGCILNAAMGALSHLVPLVLSTSRTSSNKKRTPYQERLTMIMDRWRAIQIGGLSLGTMGLGLLAALTWNVPLNSMSIRAMTWICFALLLSSLLLFSVKLAMALTHRPEDPSPVTT